MINFKKRQLKENTVNFLIRNFLFQELFINFMPYEKFFEFFILWINSWKMRKMLKCRKFLWDKKFSAVKGFFWIFFLLPQPTSHYFFPPRIRHQECFKSRNPRISILTPHISVMVSLSDFLKFSDLVLGL